MTVAAPARPRPRGRFWFTVHAWVGLKPYVVLSVILISGTLAVFAHEIDWLLQPEQRVEPRAERAPLGSLVAAVEGALGRDGMMLDGSISTSVTEPEQAAIALVVSREHGAQRLWVDPYTLEVKGRTAILSPGTILAQLHESLFILDVGGALVSLFALFVTTSLVTGILTYKRWCRGFLRRPRDRTPRLFAGDLHRLLGVGSIAFLAIVAVTSVFYLWDYVFDRMIGLPGRESHAEHAVLSEEQLARLRPEPPQRLPIDTLVAAVHERHPDFVVSLLSLPMNAAEPLCCSAPSARS